eukprot:8144277-Pyramimonas_sp.AAC.1
MAGVVFVRKDCKPPPFGKGKGGTGRGQELGADLADDIDIFPTSATQDRFPAPTPPGANTDVR